MTTAASRIPDLLAKHERFVLDRWIAAQLRATTLRPDLLGEAQLREDSARFVSLLRRAAASGGMDDLQSSTFADVRDFVARLTHERARLGFTASETATFVFSLKEPLFALVRDELGGEPSAMTEVHWALTTLLDKLGLYSTELHQKAREEVIERQRSEMLELSTPVVTLADGILALPLIGTLDSSRTQAVMESLLQRIVDQEARIAIIDITGVPTVDTLTAQHLLKTVTATRLMGAECIISGIRPQIAQTIVHLGVDLGDITTKATLAGALQIALQRLGRSIVDTRARQG